MQWLLRGYTAVLASGQHAARSAFAASLALLLLLLLQGRGKVLCECHWVDLPQHRVVAARKDLLKGSKSSLKLHAWRHGRRCC